MSGGTPAWVIVNHDFARDSGQGVANHALASHLADRGVPLHLVAVRVEPELAGRSGVVVHQVPRARHYPARELLLDLIGRRVARRVTSASPGARVVVNGASCRWPDVNWVHMVHRAYSPRTVGASLPRRAAMTLSEWRDRWRERWIARCRVVIANSERTRQDVVRLLGAPAAHVRTVLLGCDPDAFRPPTDDERRAAREELGIPAQARVVLFVGAHGPELRKGLDVLLVAWSQLGREERLRDALLVTAGAGALDYWGGRVRALGLERSIRLLGPTPQVPLLMAAGDVMASPTRYDAYGLNVREALNAGLPVITTREVGALEHLPPALVERVTVRDPEDPSELAARLVACLDDLPGWRREVAAVGEALRRWTWDAMAAQLVDEVGRS